jgi:hypothetical protein
MELNMPEEIKGKVGKKMSKNTIMLIIICGLVLIAAVLFFLLGAGSGASSSSNLKNSSQQVAQAAEDKKVLDQLKKIMLLPDNITPTMAIITDADILKKQQPDFFANAKNGQRLIVYPDTAIIFDPQTNIIIKAGGIQIVAPPAAAPTK